ncbi:hypothetical protein DS909_05615 [Phaeobacter gallaeciensis]|uniref:Uncharacterized protein n=1 Tax=Phaeobacter gallaeciensis TaxID=60890 RepID=A0A366X1X2_9RHOB|nr:hypothetical protein [Phaeobacter gallaeciensis]RBW58443.1 hypothetical protein DS909_05615 [Phaeobacter gallaeciensis]
MNRIVNEEIEPKDDTQADDQKHNVSAPENAKVVPIKEPWNDPDGEWNDAFVYGDPCAEFDRLMTQTVSLTLGMQFVDKYRHGRDGTSKGKWKRTTAHWWTFAEGVPREGNIPEWGLTRSPVGKEKDGMCYVGGICDGGFRTTDAMSTMGFMGLDFDAYITLDELGKRVYGLGVAAFMNTTFNHGKTTVDIPVGDVLKASADGTKSIEAVRVYLDCEGWGEDFVDAVEIEDDNFVAEGKRVVRCSCPPITKARVIVPLAEPIDLTQLSQDPKAGAEMFSARVRGLAQMVGLPHDERCEDSARMFFIGKHSKGAEFDVSVFRAPPIRWEDIPEVEKPGKRGANGDRTIPKNVTVEIDGVTVNVTDQYYRYGKRWNLSDIIPEEMLHGDADGGRVMECAWQGNHSDTEKMGGTIVYDADGSNTGFAKIDCKHSCGNKHTVYHLAELLERGLIDPADLEEAAYMVPLADGQDETFCRPTPEEMMEAASASADSNVENDDLEARCGAFNKDSKAAEIERLLKDLFDKGVDVTDRARVNDILSEKTRLGKRDLNKMWQALDRVQKKIDKDAAKMSDDGSQIVFIDSDVDKQWEYAQARLDAANVADPFLFEYMGELSRVRRIKGKLRTEALDEKHFRHHLNTHAPFYKRQGEDGKVKVMAPKDVAEHLFTRDHDHYPPLSRVTSLPFFTANGELVATDGYHRQSEVYLDMGGLELPPVPYEPTEGQVYDAKKLLITEFADFPLGGKTRAEILKAIEGADIPDIANLMALIIQPFVREMYDKTPAAVVNKPMPGTGAGLLTDCVHLIVDGTKATATPMPKNKDEMPKTLLSVLRSSGTYIFWDNINHEMESAELAAAITGNPYNARLLGVSATLDIYVRAGMIFGANTLRMSDELRRRCYLIGLDAKCERPEDRGGWHRDDIEQWVTDHRAEYVHAVLVLVNNWLAKGGTDFTDTKIASFEGWSKVLGGILRDAGINGFLGNRDQLYEEVSDEKTGEIYRLVAVMAAQARKDKNYDFRVGKQKKGSRFLGILDLLNTRVDDEITLDDWNPKRLITSELEYNDTGTAGKRFKDAARNPYTVTFAEVDDERVEWEVTGVVTFKAEKYRGDLYYELLFEEKQRVPVPVENEHDRRTR